MSNFKNIRKVFTAILVVSMLSGCATLGQPLKPSYKESIKNIAVVAVMGNSFYGVKVGTTVFNNDQFEEDFSDFDMDEKIEKSVSKYIKQYSGINTIIRSDLRGELGRLFGYKAQIKKPLEYLGLTLENLKAEGIDAVLIISPSENVYNDTTISINGYGLVVETFLMMWRAQAYFISNITLVDTSMRKIIFDKFYQWLKPINFSKWKGSFSDLIPTEQEAIRGFFNNTIDSEIPKYLKKSNF
jgi:hypothetical protein